METAEVWWKPLSDLSQPGEGWERVLRERRWLLGRGLKAGEQQGGVAGWCLQARELPAGSRSESWNQGPERAEGRGSSGGAYLLVSPCQRAGPQRTHERAGERGMLARKSGLYPKRKAWGGFPGRRLEEDWQSPGMAEEARMG